MLAEESFERVGRLMQKRADLLVASGNPPPLFQQLIKVSRHLDPYFGSRAEANTPTTERGEDSQIRAIVDQADGNLFHETFADRHQFVTAMIRHASSGKYIQRPVV